jgi:hypothetical protein
MTVIRNSRVFSSKTGNATSDVQNVVASIGAGGPINFNQRPSGNNNAIGNDNNIMLQSSIPTPAGATHLILTVVWVGCVACASGIGVKLRQDTTELLTLNHGAGNGTQIYQHIIDAPSGTHDYSIFAPNGAAYHNNRFVLMRNFVTVDESGITSVGSSVEPISQ